jgi:hypothetical protein
LKNRSPDEPDADERTRAHARFQLGQNLVVQYRRTGNFNDLEWGLRHVLDAVEATPPDDPDRAKRLEFLANSLLEALQRFSPEEARSELARGHMQLVVSSLQESVRLTPPDDSGLPWRLNSLAVALRLRFDHSRDIKSEGHLQKDVQIPGDIGDLDQAEEVLQKAAAAAADSVQQAAIYGNLGTTLILRYDVTGDRESLNAAVVAYQNAAAVSPPESPHHAGHLRNLALALARSERDEAGVDQAFTEAAQVALDGPASNPMRAVEFLVQMGQRAEAAAHWVEAAEAFAKAQRRLDALFRAQDTRRFQTRQLGEELDVAVRLAYARARAGQLDGAMVTLECGRGRLLSEALMLSEVDPERLRAVGRPDLAEALAQAVADVRRLEGVSLNPDSAAYLHGSAEASQAQSRLNTILRQAGAIPGMDCIAAEPDSGDIRRLVAGEPVGLHGRHSFQRYGGRGAAGSRSGCRTPMAARSDDEGTAPASARIRRRKSR